MNVDVVDKLEDYILIYQMGKVGSSTIRRTLNKANFKTKQFHYIKGDYGGAKDEMLINLGEEKLRQFSGKIVTLMRDPVARNISAFFQNLTKFNIEINDTTNTQEMAHIFLEHYSHKVPNSWFDSEFKETTGCDVFAHYFPREKGFLNLRHKKMEILVLKAELSDSKKIKILSDFVNTENPLVIYPSNIGDNKYYAQVYSNFIKEIKLPKSYLNEMYTGKLVKHFYTQPEIDKFIKRWS